MNIKLSEQQDMCILSISGSLKYQFSNSEKMKRSDLIISYAVQVVFSTKITAAVNQLQLWKWGQSTAV